MRQFCLEHHITEGVFILHLDVEVVVRPGLVGGSPHYAGYQVELVEVGCSLEKDRSKGNFSHDTADGPDVDGKAVLFAAPEYFWSPVLPRDDFLGEWLGWICYGSGESEVS